VTIRAAALAAVAGVVAGVPSPAAPAPQRYAAAPAGIAPVPMGATCRAEASADVDVGAAWLLAGEPEPARAAFERAVDLDPDCALGYWGQALAGFGAALAASPDDGTAASTAGGRAIEAAIGRALAVPARSPLEIAAGAALRALRDRVAAPGVPAAWPARIAAYRDALCAGAAADRLVRVWCARALADAVVSGDLTVPAAAALAHVVELAREGPLDAGAAFIALQVAEDRTAPIVARAMDVIAGANPPAPRPHLAVAGAAADRGEWTAAAASAARAAATADDPEVRWPALDAELEALMQLGRRREAYARAGAAVRLPADARFEDRQQAARAFARLVLADRRIDGRGLGDRGALSLGSRERQHWPAVFVEALDQALRAWPGGDAALLARARASLDTLETRAGEHGPNEADWAAAVVEAAMAASQDEHQQMAVFLTHAAGLEANPATRWLGRARLVPSRELAAELWLRTYRYEDATREALAVLKAQPGRVSPHVVLARAAERLNDRAGAAEHWRRVLELRAGADADDTLRLEAERALAAGR
jgi:hypothetical protein